MANTPFPNRYGDMYHVNFGALQENPWKEKMKRDAQAPIKFLSAMAPMAMTAAGTATGAVGSALTGGADGGKLTELGAKLGQAEGTAVGAAGNYLGDRMMDDDRDAALHRQALLDAIKGLR